MSMPYKDPQKQKAAQRRSTVRQSNVRRLRQKAKREELRQWIVGLKKDKPCTDCKRSFHFAAMEWDHLPQYEKLFAIREAVNRYQNKSLIEAEIAKCELVCANCHAVRTYERAQKLL